MVNLIAVMIFAFVCLGTVALYRARQQPLQPDEGESGLEQPPTERKADSFLDRWERAALQAGLGWGRQVYFGAVGMGVALAGILTVVGAINLAIVGLLAGAIGPHWYVRRQQARRSEQFARQLPQALFLASSVLRAGGTLLQAIDAIAAEMPNPIREEFERIQQQIRLQVPAHEAMADAQQRVGVREFAAVVVAARITAEVGGNLAHLFDQIARAITDAQNARRTVQSFTTEGRMSANMIAGLPFVVLGMLHLLSPGYFEPLFTTWEGRAILILCFGTIILGWVTIRRMVDIRIY
jgi:tight adherence protein B